MISIRNVIRFLVVVALVALSLCGYVLYHYTFVLKDNPLFKPSVEKPLLTLFSDRDNRSNHPLGSQLSVYVINLDRSKDRWKRIKPKLDEMHIPYHRLSGVDGKEISSDVLRMNLDENRYVELMGEMAVDGEIGCYLSHYFAIHEFLASSSSYALVLEDDIDFDPSDLTQVIQDLLRQEDKWDIVNLKPLYGHNYWKTVGTLAQSKRSLVEFTSTTAGTAAYLLNRKAGYALLQKSLPIVMPYDWYFTRDWEFGIKYRGVFPSFQLHSLARKSNIKAQRPHIDPAFSRYTSSFFRKSTKTFYKISNIFPAT